MTKEELKEMFKGIDETKQKVLETMYDDFLFEIEQLEQLKPQLQKIGVPKNKGQAEQKKYLQKEYSDLSQRHDSKIKIMLSQLNKEDTSEADLLMEKLSKI